MIRRSLTLQFIVLLCASSAWAQAPRAAGPFAGLFGGRGTATHTLDFAGVAVRVQSKALLPAEAEETTELDRRFLQSGSVRRRDGHARLSVRSSRGKHQFFG